MTRANSPETWKGNKRPVVFSPNKTWTSTRSLCTVVTLWCHSQDIQGTFIRRDSASCHNSPLTAIFDYIKKMLKGLSESIYNDLEANALNEAHGASVISPTCSRIKLLKPMECIYAGLTETWSNKITWNWRTYHGIGPDCNISATSHSQKHLADYALLVQPFPQLVIEILKSASEYAS